MKKIGILFYALIVALCVNAQVVTIKNKGDQQGVENAIIVSDNSSTALYTNNLGQADIIIFKDASIIQISAEGLKTIVTSYSKLAGLNFIVLMETTGVELDEVVVSANKWAQASKDIPTKISVISVKDIALQNPQTAADLLGSSGEVFIQKSQQGGGSPMIRGFSTNRLLYSIDGVRMNTAIFRGGNLQNVISLDPFATEKAEVFFGPGSVIYGSDAIGGVMSFKTLTPQLSYSDTNIIAGKAVTRYSSANNEKTVHFDINVGWKKWSILTSLTSNDFDDLKMGSHGPSEYLRPFYVQRQDSVDVVVTNEDPRIQRPSSYSQINMMQKIRFKPNDKWDIQYGFHYSETSDYARYDRHIRYKNGLPRYGEWSYGPQKWMMNNLTIDHNGENKLYDRMSIRIAQQYFEESRIDRNINADGRHIRIEKVDAYSLNIDFTKKLTKKHKLFYGVEGVQNIVKSIGVDEDIATNVKAVGPARYPQSNWASYAAYLNHQWRISEKLLVQTGARYNQYILNAEFDTTFYPFPYTSANMNNGALTGSIGVVYRPTTKWAISLNGSTGFRSPNIDDMGKVFDSEPGFVIIPNPDLKSEYAYNGELSIAKVFGNVLKVDVVGFYTVLQDALVRRDFTLNGLDSMIYDGSMSKIQAIQNAAIGTVYGIQVGIDVKLPSGFGFSSDINFQKGEEELDDATISPSRHAAPLFGVSKLTYTKNNLILQLNVLYSGSKSFDELPLEEQAKAELYAIGADGKPYSPSWYTLNFKAMYQFHKNFSISGGLENITDQRYRSYSSGMAGAGRNIILSVKATF